MVFPHIIDSGNPITTISVSYLHIIATATEVNVFPSPIHLLPVLLAYLHPKPISLQWTILPKIWCARNLVLGRLQIECLLLGTQSWFDWRIGGAFSWMIVMSRYLYCHLLLCALRSELNTDLVLSGSRTSSQSTCSWTSLAPLCDLFSSLMISFGCSKVSSADGGTLWCLQIHCDVGYCTNKHLYPINTWNVINSIHSIRTYIHTTTNCFPPTLLILHSVIFIKSLQSLSILICSGHI